jgi:hypothetical protein
MSNVNILKVTVSKIVGYSSVNTEYKWYFGLVYLKEELSLNDMAFQWFVPVLSF